MELNRIDLPLLTADQLASYAEIEKMYGRGQEARKLPLDMVYVRNGFNHRINFGDIRSLADFLLGGGKVPPIEVDILKDGKAILLAGERRVRAHKLLVGEGHAQFNIIQAFVSPRTLTERDRIAKSASSNNNKQFEPLELAHLFQDLKERFNMSNIEIAKETGHNQQHVSNQLRLAGVTEEEKDLIRDGSVSSTTVLDMVKKKMPASARLDTIRTGGSDGKKVKIKDVEIMGDLKPKEFDPNENPKDIFKQVFIRLNALNKMIGTDSKMSDVTFHLENDLRNLQRIVIDGEDLLPVKDRAIDPLFAESARIIFEHQNASTSLLQRRLKLGYNRANRLMDQLEVQKIIGPFQGSKPREILFKDFNELEIALDFITKNSTEDDQPF